MRVSLAYGKNLLELELPSEARVEVLQKQPVPPLRDPLAALREGLVRPLGTRPLRELAAGRRDAVIVISDRTRPVPNAVLLPPLLDALADAGIARESVSVQVATGLHRAATPAELREILGGELASALRIVQHDAHDRDAHAFLGTSKHGIPAWIDRHYLERDLRILTGLIEPHLMAGYSGGRKAVCPGLAAVDTIRIAHGPILLEGPLGPGLLRGNPLHEDLVEIARHAGVDFIVNVALDRERRIAGVFCGDLEQAHEAGAAFVEEESLARVDQEADVVIVSAGGDPLDATFYQAIKGISAAAGIVRPGGVILLCAALREGVGSPAFEQLVRSCASAGDFETRLKDPAFFSVDQWMLQHLCQALRRCRVLLASDGLPLDSLRQLLVEPFRDPAQALASALAGRPPDARVAVLPQGPYVLATVRGIKRPVGRGDAIPTCASAALGAPRPI
jgi:nickel-dependent lactate racemase